MSRIIKDTLILFAITLVAGLGLGVVFNVTKDARKEQEDKTQLAAYEAVMPGLDKFEDIKLPADINSNIKDMVSKNESDNKISTIKEFNAEIEGVVSTVDKDGNKGYIVTVNDKEAYGGSIKMTVGIMEDGTVNGISFLSISETPGLGMKAKEDSFMNSFKNKKVDFFEYTKADKTKDNQIDAISSATITTNAVTHGVNAAIYCVDILTGGEGNE